MPAGAGTRVELTNPLSQVARRDSDRLGRLTHLSYLNEAPKLTPDVAFGYDLAGNRTRMSEDDGTNPVRETGYAFDAARRLTGVDFDTDGDSQVEQSVAYEYDAGGLRTKLTLPGDLSLTYTYDTRGQLVGLEDWDGQVTRYTYDLAGRLVATERENGFRTRYVYDAGGRLRQLRHARGGRTLGHFAYEVDALGNRTQALEALPRPGTGQTVLGSDHGALDYHRGTWTASDDLMTSPDPDAALRVAFFGDSATLTLGVGPDHGLCDVYVDGGLWQSFDNYADLAGEDEITLPLQGEGPHVLEVRNRSDKNRVSTGYHVAFKSLMTESLYDLHTIRYGYDGLSRLQSADYFPGEHVGGTPFRQYAYAFDLVGNRISETVAFDGVPTQTAYTYNAANQITSGGVTYDTAGRMTSDGVNTFVWDRADRLLSMGGVANAYNGLGQRVAQSVDSIVTEYLLDVQPGLVKVLSGAIGSSVTRYVHGPSDIQGVQDGLGMWTFPIQDGLGSVRDGALGYSPYGIPDMPVTGFAFTGEMRDANGLQYHRTRYYMPGLGVWPSLDPMEDGNRYAYVGGNPVNNVDPSGLVFWKWISSASASRIGRPSQYTRNNALAHPWIEFWMEDRSSFWHAHAEFPGGSAEGYIDILVFDSIAYFPGSSIPSPVYFTAPVTGSVYEIEPANRVESFERKTKEEETRR